jgi:hypothetical protein
MITAIDFRLVLMESIEKQLEISFLYQVKPFSFAASLRFSSSAQTHSELPTTHCLYNAINLLSPQRTAVFTQFEAFNKPGASL